MDFENINKQAESIEALYSSGERTSVTWEDRFKVHIWHSMLECVENVVYDDYSDTKNCPLTLRQFCESTYELAMDPNNLQDGSVLDGAPSGRAVHFFGREKVREAVRSSVLEEIRELEAAGYSFPAIKEAL